MKNFSTALVAVAPSPAISGTSLEVASGQGSRFVVGPAAIRPGTGASDPTNSEVVVITAISAGTGSGGNDVVTLTRAQESSVARLVQVGDRLVQGVTAGMWDSQVVHATVVQPSGDTTGATDRAAWALAMALTPGGTVMGVPGAVYYTNAPLVIPLTFTGKLDGAGSEIQLVAGTNTVVMWDAAHAAGTLTVPSPMGSYSVENFTFNKGSNSGGGNGLHNVILGGNVIKVRNCHFKSSAGKYSLLLQNVVGFTIADLTFAAFSDGLHIQGPASRGRVRNLSGTTGDDMFAITACDYSAYTWGNEGNVTDVQCDGISLTGGNARAAIVLSGTQGSALTVSDVRVANIFATQSATNAQPLVIIGEDVSQATTRGGNLTRVTVDGLGGALNTASQSLVSINYYSGSTNVFDHIAIRNVDVATDCQNVVFNSAKINNLTVDGVRGAVTATPNAIVAVNNSGTYSSIARLRLRNIDYAVLGTRGGSLFRCSASGATVGDIMISDVRIDNLSWLLDIITSSTVRAANVNATNMGGTLNVRSPAAVTIAGWSGVSMSATNSTITATGTVRSLASDFVLDLTNAQVAKSTGDRATARVLAGTIPAGTPAVYSGTAWVGAAGGTL